MTPRWKRPFQVGISMQIGTHGRPADTFPPIREPQSFIYELPPSMLYRWRVLVCHRYSIAEEKVVVVHGSEGFEGVLKDASLPESWPLCRKVTIRPPLLRHRAGIFLSSAVRKTGVFRGNRGQILRPSYTPFYHTAVMFRGCEESP